MGTNASKDTRQVWIHKALHWAASKFASKDIRTKRSAIEISIAKGLGYDSVHDVIKDYEKSEIGGLEEAKEGDAVNDDRI